MSNTIKSGEPGVKVAEVNQALGNLDYEVDRFDRLSQILFSRLACILRPADPLGESLATDQVGFLAPLAEQIQTSVRKLDSTNDRLNDIINLLEI